MRQCRDCGHISNDNDNICPVCGRIFDETDLMDFVWPHHNHGPRISLPVAIIIIIIIIIFLSFL